MLFFPFWFWKQTLIIVFILKTEFLNDTHISCI